MENRMLLTVGGLLAFGAGSVIAGIVGALGALRKRHQLRISHAVPVDLAFKQD